MKFVAAVVLAAAEVITPVVAQAYDTPRML